MRIAVLPPPFERLPVRPTNRWGEVRSDSTRVDNATAAAKASGKLLLKSHRVR